MSKTHEFRDFCKTELKTLFGSDIAGELVELDSIERAIINRRYWRSRLAQVSRSGCTTRLYAAALWILKKQYAEHVWIVSNTLANASIVASMLQLEYVTYEIHQNGIKLKRPIAASTALRQLAYLRPDTFVLVDCRPDDVAMEVMKVFKNNKTLFPLLIFSSGKPFRIMNKDRIIERITK